MNAQGFAPTIVSSLPWVFPYLFRLLPSVSIEKFSDRKNLILSHPHLGAVDFDLGFTMTFWMVKQMEGQQECDLGFWHFFFR